MTAYSHLLAPGRIGALELRNRILMCPMGDNLASDDGGVNERQLAYYEARARGGAALLLVGSTAVMYPRGAYNSTQTAVSDDRFIPGLSALAERVHRHGALLGAQLVHDGGTSLYDIQLGRPVLVPSKPRPPQHDPLAAHYTPAEIERMMSPFTTPTSKLEHRPATEEDLEEVVSAFASSAARCIEAGFDAVEIHAGHGYLIDSFLSPYSNLREDQWGGSLENRSRLLREVVAAVRAAVAAPVWVRLNAREYFREPGETLDEAVLVAAMAEAAGADAIHVTAYGDPGIGIGFTEAHTPHTPGMRVPDAIAVKSAVTVPVITYGRLEPDEADAVLARGDADFIAMGRKLLAEPDLPNKLTAGRADDVRPCIYQYRCIGNIFVRDKVSCVANAATADGDEATVPAAARRRHVLVVGGGPAGMEVARTLSQSGHRVTLCEASESLGGRLRDAAACDEALDRFLGWLRRGVDLADVDLRLSTTVDAASVAALAPDEIVVATGATWPGFDAAPSGERVLVHGSGVAALRLARRWRSEGREVTVADAATAFATELGIPGRFRILHDALQEGIVLAPGTTSFEAVSEGADAVVDVAPGDPVRPDLTGVDLPIHVLGDATGEGHGIELAMRGARQLTALLAR
jgi:2,4-dienoyl-CoA reductase-like NADH-dependent reductase (Old Yellow Enzyme family)